jgi:hypothetical protein
VRRLVRASGLALVLLAPIATGSMSAAAAESPAQCYSYTVGSDAHTECVPSATTPPGASITCQDYTVGSDTHAECAPVPAPRVSAPREKKAGPVPPPASALRCYTYHIGSSAYTDCR